MGEAGVAIWKEVETDHSRKTGLFGIFFSSSRVTLLSFMVVFGSVRRRCTSVISADVIADRPDQSPTFRDTGISTIPFRVTASPGSFQSLIGQILATYPRCVLLRFAILLAILQQLKVRAINTGYCCVFLCLAITSRKDTANQFKRAN
jgi:hypothetical protein